jgi:hypothetical protein
MVDIETAHDDAVLCQRESQFFYMSIEYQFFSMRPENKNFMKPSSVKTESGRATNFETRFHWPFCHDSNITRAPP